MNLRKSQYSAVKWEEIKRIFESAINEPPSKRLQHVRSLCHGDPTLEEEVARLVTADQGASTFLESPLTITLDNTFTDRQLNSFYSGEIIARRFRIIRFLASGGMGEVYEAWDSELQESVALKTIRPEIAASNSIIERFKLEVKQARAISHPNICRVYDIFSHEHGGSERTWFLTMELLKGETLSDKLRREGPFDVHQALALTKQLVEGLAAAHKLGVVHRDFKSGNIMVSKEVGEEPRVVITDFGLAIKVASNGVHGTMLAEGTPEYMAPEQTRGGPVGFAADQYALGIVMCEMLSGGRPVRKQLEPSRSIRLALPVLPRRWSRVVQRCLEEQPCDRFSDVTTILNTLSPDRRRKVTAIWVVATGMLLAIAVGSIYLGARNEDTNRLIPLEPLTPLTGLSGSPSISNDGRAVAYMSDRGETGNLDIWLQHLSAGSPIRLTKDPAEDVDPSISPDGRFVAFRSYRDGGGIYIVDSTTGAEKLLVHDGLDPRFSPDGTKILFWVGDEDATHTSGKMYSLELGNQRVTQLVAGFTDARLPIWNTDGHHILFTGCGPDDKSPTCGEWWIMDTDTGRLLKSGALARLRAQQITPMNALGSWSNDTVVFSGRRGQATSLWEIRVAPDGPTIGDARQISSTDPTVVVPSSSLARDGTIAFSQMTAAVHIWRIDDALSRKKASAIPVTHDPGIDSSPSVSPNGRWLAFSRGRGSHHNIWVQDTQSGLETQFSEATLDEVSPIIDNSGQLVVFEVLRANARAIVMKRLGHDAVELCTACSSPTSWYKNSDWFFYRDESDAAIKMMNTGTHESRTVAERKGYLLSEASWSDNGYLLFSAAAYDDKKQVFALPFSANGALQADNWIAITQKTEWGDKARWSGDGSTIFYLSKRDGFPCVWAQRFDPKHGRIEGRPVPVMHYHNPRLTPETVSLRSFELTLYDRSIYLNLGEVTESIWTGKIRSLPLWRF